MAIITWGPLGVHISGIDEVSAVCCVCIENCEGFFFANLRGPGHVWLQSLPFSRLAGRIWEAAPQTGGGGQDEGSMLGGLADILKR